MAEEIILLDQVGKKFHRTLLGGFLSGVSALARGLLRLKPRGKLAKDEFWALKDISCIVRRGECLGVIGPNGAGKSTLLKLIHREYRPDEGRLLALGKAKSLIHLGSGLQPQFSGRENIYLQCQQLGLDKFETDARVDEIIAFAGLQEAIDRPVKTYSDGMYARLEFAVATSVQMDILLVDEVLAVGDIAFQIRALDRLNQLKRNGAAIVFVSHSEMNVRHVADRCLLLFNGRQVGLGEPDALFYQYYQSIGYLNQRLRPLGTAMPIPQETIGPTAIHSLCAVSAPDDGLLVRTGSCLELVLEYEAKGDTGPACLILHFWSAAEILAASVDSALFNKTFQLAPGRGKLKIEIPFLPLTPGYYRITAGFGRDGQWLAYSGYLLELHVYSKEMSSYHGQAVMAASFEQETG